MAEKRYFEVKRHEPWLYSIKDRMEVYCWLLVGSESALLLDTGYGFGDLPAEARGITDLPLTVALSHGHADHALGACQFERVYMHPADREVFSEHSGEKWRKKAADAVKKNSKKLEPYIGDFDFDAYVGRSGGETHALDEDAVFDLGGLAARVIPMAGHTPGSIGLYVPEHRALITSDAANRATFMFMPESLPIAKYVEMLKKTARLDFAVHYTGHQDTAYPKKWFGKYVQVAENALAGKGKPMKIPGFEEYGEILVSSVGGPIVSPAFCAVGYTADKLS